MSDCWDLSCRHHEQCRDYFTESRDSKLCHHLDQGSDQVVQLEEALPHRRGRHDTEPITRHRDHWMSNTDVVYNSYLETRTPTIDVLLHCLYE